MSKSQSSLNVCWRFAFLLGALMTFVLLHRETSFAGSGSTMKSFAQGTRPFNMVTLGDSIMWGQGLPEQMKFRTLVANWLQSQYGSSRNVVQWFTHAHSGAVTGWGLYPAETNGNDPDTWYLTNAPAAEHMALGGLSSGDIYPGEVPFGYLSISAQIGMTVNELKGRIDPADVDLVLLDGGINDLSVANILDVTATDHLNGPLWVRRHAEALCVNHMKSLLPQVLSQFPNAVVILTGYFPMVSESSDLNEVAKFLEMHLHVNSPGPSVGGDPFGYIDGVRAATLTLSVPVRAAMADRSQAWSQTALSGFTDLVNQANQGLTTPSVALAWPNFSDDNAYAAPNTFLFTLGEFLSDEKRGSARKPPAGDWSTPQGVAYYRAQNCTQYDMWDPLCYEAMLGHPNAAGAQAYADAIIGKLQVFSAKLGLPLPKTFFTRVHSGTDSGGPYVYISNRPNEPPQVNNYWTQVPAWFQVNAVDGSNNPVQANVAVQPIPPPYWPFQTQSIEAVDFGVLPNGYDSGLATLPNGSYTQPGEPTGRKIYYMCLPAGTPVRGPAPRPANFRSFAGNQQGCWVQVSAPGYVTCVVQLGQAPTSSAGILGGLFGGGGSATLPGPPCPLAPTTGGVVASVQNNTTAGGIIAGMTGQHLQVQLPALAATVCPTVDGKSCLAPNSPRASSPLVDLVIVTSEGKPVSGATVSVSGQATFTAVSNVNGIAVISHLPCYQPGSQVPKIGQTTVPVRTPVPCQVIVSKSGYQSFGTTLP